MDANGTLYKHGCMKQQLVRSQSGKANGTPKPWHREVLYSANMLHDGSVEAPGHVRPRMVQPQVCPADAHVTPVVQLSFLDGPNIVALSADSRSRVMHHNITSYLSFTSYMLPGMPLRHQTAAQSLVHLAAAEQFFMADLIALILVEHGMAACQTTRGEIRKLHLQPQSNAGVSMHSSFYSMVLLQAPVDYWVYPSCFSEHAKR